MLRQVLVGQEEDLAGAVHAADLVEGPGEGGPGVGVVHTVPPCRPVNALIAADEFI